LGVSNVSILIYYLFIVNVVSLLLFYYDKNRAKKGKYRVSENTLFMISFIGGSMGSIIGMHLFSHKTKKAKFLIGLPLILLLNIIAIYYVTTGLLF